MLIPDHYSEALNDVPRAAGAEGSHCRRVAAWSVELATIFNVSLQEQTALERAALSHHLPAFLFTARRKRFLRDLGIAELANDDSVDQVHEILAVFHQVKGTAASGDCAKLAAILELANALDERFEWEPFADQADEKDAAFETALKHLQTVAGSELESAIETLPALPATAPRSLHLLSTWNTGVADVESIAAADAVLMDHLVRAADSEGCGPSRTRAALPVAIKRIGVRNAAKVLYAGSLRPLFARPALQRVWNHSIGVAQLSELLARISDQCDSDRAFVAGLLHDVGRLPMALLPIEFQQRFGRMFKKGCEPVLIEKALCAFTHAAAGAIVARNWGLPPEVADAVEHHHQPERSASKLAAILCLADEPAEVGEDLPSILRRKAALKALNLDEETLRNVRLPAAGVLNGLTFGA